MAEKWWNKQLRIIQYNLQMKDTSKMDPEKIAAETAEMGADTVVINVADSVVWYYTGVACQKINPYLPKDRDLLKELIDAFHCHGIRVWGRGAFMGFEEETYYQRPDWARRDPNGNPVTIGNERPGEWFRLYSPCPLGGFSYESGNNVAREAFEKYDLDGAFWLKGSLESIGCFCSRCKSKYREIVGENMPADPKLLSPKWHTFHHERAKASMKAVLQVKPDMPYLHYYWPFDLDIGIGVTIPADNIDEMAEFGNTLCTEAQDVLSMGAAKLPYWNTPALRMKMGRTIKDFPPPVGIIHACPGMDWRHACMPEAEFLYWASQIPANGGSYWTTFTGFCDTITDKRIFRTVRKLNTMVSRMADDMDGAESDCDVLLLSDGGINVQGWAEALMTAHIDFDMLAAYQFTEDRIHDYKLLIFPNNFRFTDAKAKAVSDYVKCGGSVIIESVNDEMLKPVRNLIGLKDVLVASEELEASDVRLEDEAAFENLQECRLVPLRARIGFGQFEDGMKVLATWVPPFSAAKTAGFPPERASLPAEKTDIALALCRTVENGRVLFLPYEPGRLVKEYEMDDMFRMIEAYTNYMLPRRKVKTTAPKRVMTTVFKKDNLSLIHLVNGIGSRPLIETIPVYGIDFEIRTDRKAADVASVIAGEKISFSQENTVLSIHLDKLDVWDMIRITYAE